MPTVLKVEIGALVIIAINMAIVTATFLLRRGETSLWTWGISALVFLLVFYIVVKDYRRWKDPVVANIDAAGRAEIANQAKTDRIAAVKLARSMDPRLNVGEAMDYVISVERKSKNEP